MNEGLIIPEEKNRLDILFAGGLINLDILWGQENQKALSDAWTKAQKTSEALKDMKSVSALHVSPLFREPIQSCSPFSDSLKASV